MGEHVKGLISCVVAIYNVAPYLRECVESLINQDYKNVEIILVDDGSKDESGALCDEFTTRDARVRVIHQKNSGANLARNAGLYDAKGEWVYFADGDDYVTEDIFSALINEMTDDTDMIMFTNKRLKNGKITETAYPKDKILFETAEDFYELRLATMNRFSDSKYNYKYLDSVSIWNKLYKRSFLLENGLEFVPRFPKVQDLTFNLQVYEKVNKAVFINHPGYIYRMNEQSVTNRYQKDFISKLDVMEAWFTSYIQKEKEDVRMYRAYCGRLVTFIRTSVVVYFCNQNNEAGYRERKNKFKQLIQKEQFHTAIKGCSLSGLPAQEKILSLFVCSGCFVGCQLLASLREKFILR